MAESLNPFTIAQEQLDQAAELLKLDKATHMLLREPMRELHVSFPVRMDDGRYRVFKGSDFTRTRPSTRFERWRHG